MAIHEPPCRDWRDHLAIAVEAEDVEYHLADFLDRFDAEREQEERAAAACAHCDVPCRTDDGHGGTFQVTFVGQRSGEHDLASVDASGREHCGLCEEPNVTDGRR